MESVPEGVYQIRVSGRPPGFSPDFYLKSASANGEDILEKGLTVGAGGARGPLEVVLSSRARASRELSRMKTNYHPPGRSSCLSRRVSGDDANFVYTRTPPPISMDNSSAGRGAGLIQTFFVEGSRERRVGRSRFPCALRGQRHKNHRRGGRPRQHPAEIDPADKPQQGP